MVTFPLLPLTQCCHCTVFSYTVLPFTSINFYYSKAHCLNLFVLMGQNTINWVFLKKQKFLTVLKAKSAITVLTDLKSGEGSFPHDWYILAVSSHIGCHEWWFCVLTCLVLQQVLWFHFSFFIRVSVSFLRLYHELASHMQKSLTLNAFTFENHETGKHEIGRT